MTLPWKPPKPWVEKGAALFGLMGLFLFVWAPAAAAQLPVARLYTLVPPGATAGATVEVTARGVDLDEASELLFSHPRITAKLKVQDVPGPPNQAKFLATVAAEVPPGLYEARVRGRFGVSNPRAFAVGGLPEVLETTAHHSPDNPLEVSVGTVIDSHTYASAVNYLRFTLDRGQRILLACQAPAIDSRLEAVLILHDAEGRELAVERHGSVLDFTAPQAGPFTLLVRDLLYRGGEEYFYRLAVGAVPIVEFVFPPAALPGANGRFTLLGHNLPGGTAVNQFLNRGRRWDKLEVELQAPASAVVSKWHDSRGLARPCSVTVDGFAYRLPAARGLADPVFIAFATASVQMGSCAWAKGVGCRTLTPPCEVAGQFKPAEEADWYSFEATKGTAYWIEVFSHRLGLPTDPLVLVERVPDPAKGQAQPTDVLVLSGSDQNLGGPECRTATRDPVGRFEAPATGTFRLRVRDLFHSAGGGAGQFYLLSLRPETPDFRLLALPLAPPPANRDAKVATVWTPVLRRGETIPIKVLAFRRDNYNGPIGLSARDLPAQVSGSEATIAPGKTSTLLFLTAHENAASWSGPLRITGRATVGGTTREREARGATVVWNVADYDNEEVVSRLTQDLLLSVCGAESAPVTVQPRESKVWEVSAGGKLEMPLRVDRRGSFNAKFSLKAVEGGPLDSAKELEVAASATNVNFILDLVQAKLPAGLHPFHLQGQVAGKYRANPEAAQAAEATLKTVQQDLADLQAAVKQAGGSLPAEWAAASAAAIKMAEARQAVTSARAKQAAERAKPVDVTVTVYSPPITVKVLEPAKK